VTIYTECIFDTDGRAGDSDANGSYSASYASVVVNGLTNARLQPNNNR